MQAVLQMEEARKNIGGEMEKDRRACQSTEKANQIKKKSQQTCVADADTNECRD
jgi:hypothetical protein